MTSGASPRLVSLLGALLLTLLVSAGGCASTCREVASQRAAFLRAARPSPSSGARPFHAAIVLAYRAVNPILERHLASIPPLEVGLPGPVRALLPPLVLTTERLELRPTPAGKVGFRVTLAASLAGERFCTISADVAVTPCVNERRELVVALRPDDFDTVEPRIEPGALERLTEILWRRMPDRVRSLPPRSLIADAATATISLLGRELHQLLRATVLPRLGEVGRLQLALPRRLPVQELAFRPLGEHADSSFSVAGQPLEVCVALGGIRDGVLWVDLEATSSP